MSCTTKIRTKKQGRGRPALSGNVAIEAVRNERLDITKLAQALELYMRHLTETADVTGDTPS